MSLDINLYAEFLMHTRSVTVCATVRKDSPTFKKAYVHADRQTVSILCDDVSSIIALPLGIEIKGSVGFPVSDPAEISLRLEIAEDGQPSHGLHMAVVNDVPWSAKRLTTQSQIACRSCSQTIVPAKQRIWKDLPRGSWAETLDQWYCHRPSKDHADGTPFLGAAEPMLDSDTALVDTCHFIILGEDCVDITTESNESLLCRICRSRLGVLDKKFEGLKIFKWNVILLRDHGLEWERNSIQCLVCAQMLELMEDQNVRKFIAHPDETAGEEHGILLWVFNPDIKYSSSHLFGGRPRRAMKILYEKICSPEEMISKMQSSAEELLLPLYVFEQLEKDLDFSDSMLPEPAKRTLPAAAMQQWKVALLDRFDPPGG